MDTIPIRMDIDGPGERTFGSQTSVIPPPQKQEQVDISFHGVAWHCIAWLVSCFFDYKERSLFCF